MTPTTSTTVCAPACSTVDDLKAMPLIGEIIAEIDQRTIPISKTSGAAPSWCAS